MQAAFRYGFPVDRLVIGLKHGRDAALAALLGDALWHRVGAAARHEAVALAPVPLHRGRLRARGFNQSALIAARVSAAAGWPVYHGVRRVRDTGSQSGRGRRARAASLDGAFRVVAEPPPRLVVVDDVFTTGATARALTAALTAAGGQVMAIWCVAWAPPGRRRVRRRR